LKRLTKNIYNYHNNKSTTTFGFCALQQVAGGLAVHLPVPIATSCA